MIEKERHNTFFILVHANNLCLPPSWSLPIAYHLFPVLSEGDFHRFSLYLWSFELEQFLLFETEMVCDQV
jgi:hypothetical protein